MSDINPSNCDCIAGADGHVPSAHEHSPRCAALKPHVQRTTANCPHCGTMIYLARGASETLRGYCGRCEMSWTVED
ncbi:hypothetical protein K2Z84_21490 [Candidatus Binatia bacterium]|nr:hypothetical protein [Candidatus Binatia bacterium]